MGYHKTKSECARMKSRRSFKLENKSRTHLSNHGLNGISLHFVGLELFKKVLLVALGIWLRIVPSYFFCGRNVRGRYVLGRNVRGLTVLSRNVRGRNVIHSPHS